jgi:hypothetical protein
MDFRDGLSVFNHISRASPLLYIDDAPVGGHAAFVLRFAFTARSRRIVLQGLAAVVTNYTPQKKRNCVRKAVSSRISRILLAKICGSSCSMRTTECVHFEACQNPKFAGVIDQNGLRDGLWRQVSGWRVSHASDWSPVNFTNPFMAHTTVYGCSRF